MWNAQLYFIIILLKTAIKYALPSKAYDVSQFFLSHGSL
uniref:Uncharacterized protein n=1 Tax=Anguilla anguilla TaxID=7936 RepID=A0A0E9T8G5_ANGAN